MACRGGIGKGDRIVVDVYVVADNERSCKRMVVEKEEGKIGLMLSEE